MKINIVQPSYFMGDNPDQKISEFLIDELEKIEKDSLTLLPEYSNAGGVSDVESEFKAMDRANLMKEKASLIAKQKGAYVVINVLEKRDGKIRNSTYFFDKQGRTRFVYDKIHLPPSELKLGVSRGDGECCVVIDGIRFAFMTCYDVYFNEQIEHIAKFKPDIILIPGYQRGERTDIILAQAKLTAFRANAFVVRSSYSMNDALHGGNSMLVAPDGKILFNMGIEVGSKALEVDEKEKYTRTAGFGGGIVRNDDFINDGLCPQIFDKSNV